MSYMGNLDVGIVADRYQMPDVSRLIDWLRDGVAELLPPRTASAAGSRWRKSPRQATDR